MGEAALLALLCVFGRTPVHKANSGYEKAATAGAFSYDFAQPQRVEIGGRGPTRVSAENSLPMPVWGYGLLRVSIDNSAGPAQRVRLRYVSGVGGGGRTVEKSVEVRAGERLQLALPIPSALRYGRLLVQAPGVVEGSEPNLYFSYVNRPQRAVLALGAAEQFESLTGQRPANSDPAVMVMPIAPAEAPVELAAYVGYDAVAVASGTFEELPPGVQRALEAYAATGGVLILGTLGRGTFAALPLLPAGEAEGRLSDYGFGQVSLVASGSTLDAAFFASTQAVKPKDARASWQRRGFGGGTSVDDVLLPQALAPLGRFLIIIVLFTLAIGPGSVWVARRRGPGALLLTIPGTAFVTCALIIGYSLARDGFTVHAGIHGMSLLDRERNRAITVGIGAFYANLAPSKAVYPVSSAVVGMWENGSDNQAAGIVWGEGARFGSDFLPSRSYREWGLVGVEPTRARLVLKEEGDGLKVQNALGARLEAMQVQWKGELWVATEVRDGAEQALRRARPWLHDRQSTSAPSPAPATPALGVLAQQRFDSAVLGRMAAGLADGEFLALLEGPGLMPMGGLSVSHHESRHLVRGEVDR